MSTFQDLSSNSILFVYHFLNSPLFFYLMLDRTLGPFGSDSSFSLTSFCVMDRQFVGSFSVSKTTGSSQFWTQTVFCSTKNKAMFNNKKM